MTLLLKRIIEALEQGSFSVINPPEEVPRGGAERRLLQPSSWVELEIGGVSGRLAAAEIRGLVQENNRQAEEIDRLRKRITAVRIAAAGGAA